MMTWDKDVNKDTNKGTNKDAVKTSNKTTSKASSEATTDSPAHGSPVHLTNRNTEYLPRIADQVLARLLREAGAVQIKGPRWCGKTATAEQAAASCIYLQDPDQGANYLQLAATKPSLLLEGPEPRLIDEWQMAPQIWDAVRFALDRGSARRGTRENLQERTQATNLVGTQERTQATNSASTPGRTRGRFQAARYLCHLDQTPGRARGRFILTGSATPRKTEQPAHSGIGRIARMSMRTMSLFESGESNGNVSLSALFSGEHDIGSIVDFDIEQIAHAICRGGWPEAVTEPDDEIALSMARNYIAQLIDSDIEEMDGMARNKTWMRSILRSYARNVSSEASLATIAADMQGEPPSRETVANYVDALNRACVFDDLAAWVPRLRSKTAVRTSPTRHFCDPSLAAALLGASPRKLLADFETFGLLFESLCVRDLRSYVDAMGGEVYHYRDKTGLEADAAIVLDDGRWALVEAKLGSGAVDDAAKHLKKLAARIDSDHEGKPSFLLVVTGTNTAYCRDDGVIVAPLATLAP